MNNRVGMVSLAVAGVLLLSINAGWLELPGQNPDPEWVNLEGLADIGFLLTDTTLTRAWMSDGSLAVDGGDSNEFDLVLLRQQPESVGYEFFVRSNGGQVDTFQVMAGEELTLSVPDSVGPDVPVQWTISGQESGWPWESGDLVVELAPCAGGVQCRVEQRSVGDVPPYLVVTDREGVEGQSWDVLNEADASLTIVVPSDVVFSFRLRALDPRFGLWRGVSPLVRVVTRVCEANTKGF